MPRAWLSLLLGVCCVSACSSDEKPPGIGSENTSGSSGSLPRSGSANGDAGADAASAAGGADGGARSVATGEIGGEGVYASGGAPLDVPALCPRSMVNWEAEPLAGINSPDEDELLLAMTHDELTLVFSRGNALFVSDRSSATANFETLVPQTLPDGFAMERGLALRPDGRSLVVVAKDGTSFAELKRETRTGPFDTGEQAGRFAAINDSRTFSGDTLSSPALSSDGDSFYYTARKGETQADVWRARGLALDERKRQDHASLGTEEGKPKLVVSVSADERTLFVFDEARGHIVGFWSITSRSAFTQAEGFEGLESVFVNRACDRLYGTRLVGSSLDVVVGSPN